MEIAAAATYAMTLKRAEAQQALSIKMMSESLQQDTAALQILAATVQAPQQAASAAAAAASTGVGQLLDITA